MLIVLSLVAALVVGGVTLLVLGPPLAVLVALVILVGGVLGHRAGGGARSGIAGVLMLSTLGAGAYAGVLAIDILDALQTTSGPVDPADAVALGQAEDKLAGVGDGSSFRVELTEPELQAIAQEGLATQPDVPIRRIDIDLRGASGDAAFTVGFKSDPDLRATGTATIEVIDGGVELQISRLDFGRVRVPGLAAGAVEQLVGAVTDLNRALAQERASVQAIEVTDTSLVVTGTRATPDVLTSTELRDAITAQAGAITVAPPAEVVGRGVEASLDAPGEPFVLAIGDSLAANVGVDDARDGYVSRVHGALQRADGAAYGLLNLGVPGETSGTLLSGDQLTRAESALAGREAAYVLLDIGANDLLGHLTSEECGADLASGPCQARIEQTLVAYRQNLTRILDRVTAAADGAQVVFLQAYNPFSLGLGESAQERESDAILSRLNQVAAEVAAATPGVLVADGFTPMQGTTAATTHMLDAQPDIHPNAIGYDVLAAAIMQRLG